MNWIKRHGRNKKLSLLERTPTEVEIAAACMYYDHSFGLMEVEQRKRLALEAAEWLHSWRKVQQDGKKIEPRFPTETKFQKRLRRFIPESPPDLFYETEEYTIK